MFRNNELIIGMSIMTEKVDTYDNIGNGLIAVGVGDIMIALPEELAEEYKRVCGGEFMIASLDEYDFTVFEKDGSHSVPLPYSFIMGREEIYSRFEELMEEYYALVDEKTYYENMKVLGGMKSYEEVKKEMKSRIKEAKKMKK